VAWGKIAFIYLPPGQSALRTRQQIHQTADVIGLSEVKSPESRVTMYGFRVWLSAPPATAPPLPPSQISNHKQIATTSSDRPTFPTYNHSFDTSRSRLSSYTMTRLLFLLAALLSFFGAFGHAYLGEREIFPKLHPSAAGLNPPAVRILRVTWHTASLSFACWGSVLTMLACKSGLLSREDRYIVAGISVWYTLTGIGCVKYWDRKKPQGWSFLAISGLIQLGLMLTP
jgi:hypothetical protein